MKVLKVLILSIIFFAANDVVAQNQLRVTNNTPTNISMNFNFAAPCAAVGMVLPATSNQVASYCPGGTLVSFDISFTDNSCSPPQPVNVTVNYTSNPTNYIYTKCDGTVIHFHVSFNGSDYQVDIN